MHSKVIEGLKKGIKLNPEQRELIVGKALGDGCLVSVNGGRTARLQIEHSWHQKEYVDWLYGKLRDLVRTSPQQKLQRIQGKLYKKYWFNTLSVGALRFYYQQFYRDGKKVVPKLIRHWLTPLALAVWFMDDGSVKSKECRGKYLNTHGFDPESIKRLQSALLHNFNIETTLRKQNDGIQIYIPSSEVDKLLSIVAPYILPSMQYKVG